MDSRLVIELVRWSLNEILRLFWSGDRNAVAKAIRELLQFDVPVIGVFDGLVLVQRTDLNADQEILLLLHYAGEEGFSRNMIGRSAQLAAPAVTRSLQKLVSSGFREIVQLSNGNYRLTDLGSKRVRETLADKLVL